MKPRLSLVTAFFYLAMIIAGVRPGSAQQVQPLDPEWLQKMYAEGWHKIEEGVLQRDTGEGEPETFSYGSEGLEWILRRHQQRLDTLEEKFSQAPTKRLMEMIEQLKGEISRLNKVLAEAPSVDQFSSETMAACIPELGGRVEAAPLDEIWGVKAAAHAWFYSDCEYQADTFATAYAHAIEGTVETATTQSDSKNGGSLLDSQAVASVSGSLGCESSAQATVTSTELSVAYQTPLVQNFVCAYNTSTYTLDTTTWAQTGPGSIGPLTLAGTYYTLIDSNYSPITTSGLPQAGISFKASTSKLESQVINTTLAFADASVIKIELVGRLTAPPSTTSPILAIGHYDQGIYGVRLTTDSARRLTASTYIGGSGTPHFHHAPDPLIIGSTAAQGYRWVWTESSTGSSLGTGQWWRKISGTWEPWGSSMPNMQRPAGGTRSKMRIHSTEEGTPSGAAFDYLHASVTIGTL